MVIEITINIRSVVASNSMTSEIETIKKKFKLKYNFVYKITNRVHHNKNIYYISSNIV